MQKIVTVRDATITIPKTKTPAAICVFIISFTSSSRFPESLARVTKICTLETHLCYQWRLFLSCSWSPRRCTAARIRRCRRPSCEIYRKNTAMRLSLLTQNKSHCVGYLEDDTRSGGRRILLCCCNSHSNQFLENLKDSHRSLKNSSYSLCV
jgi:hypothetical protein